MNAPDLSNKTILITGGAGFVGSRLCQRLISSDVAGILILDNLERGSESNLSFCINDPRVEFYKDDIRNSVLLESLVSRADIIFHHAALRINACAERNHDAFEVMVKATFDLVDLAKRKKIEKLIYSSSASVYGMAEIFPTPENQHPYANQTFYGVAKLWGEQLLTNYHQMHGLNFVALRYFNVYGPGMDVFGKYTEVMIKWLDAIRENRRPGIFGDGKDTMDFVFIDDVVEANILSLSDKISGSIYNIGSGTETSLAELLEKLLLINNCSLEPEHFPENKINPVKRRLADITRAGKELNFTPKVSLDEGLKELSNWYFTQYQ